MIRVGLIGYGYWGPNLARNLVEAADCQLGAVCDQRPERLAMASRRYPSVRTTRDAQEVIEDRALDAVAIATPVSTHFDLAMEALKAGKHVLVEKPIALTSLQAELLTDEARSRARVLMVDHTFIYTGAVRKIRELVASGALGRIYYYDSVRINLGLFQHDVNVLWDLAVHDLAIMDFVLGRRALGVSALGISNFADQPENTAYLTIAFEGDVTAHLHVNWLAPVKIRRTVIGGSSQMIVYDDLDPSDKVKIYDCGVDLAKDEADVHKMLVSYRVGDMRAPRLDLTEALQTEVLHFLDCIKTGGTPESDGRAGQRVIRILEAAQESMRERGRMVAIPAERGVLA